MKLKIGDRIECPFCKAHAVKPPSKHVEDNPIWSLPNDSPLKQLQDDHKFVIERENKVMVQNMRYREALRLIMFATTLPPAAFGGDDAGFFKRELQRCIGDAARALHEEEQ